MARSRPWPFDDEDRPSGSVRPLSQADLQAILAHLNSDPDELLAGTIGDRPVVAVRVRASVGRPGGSAQATWRQMRAAEWAAWTRILPWRVAATLGIGAGGGVLGSQLAPWLGLAIGLAGHCGRLGAAVPAQPGHRCLAYGGGGGAAHRPPPGCAGAAGVGGLHDLASPAAGPTSTAMIPGGVVTVRSDPNFDRPGALRVDLSTGVVAAAGC
jgi:hypothetical protein